LRIEEYFQHIQQIVASSAVIRLSELSYQKRGSYEGFLRGELYCVDGSRLHVREFVDTEGSVARLMYAYHYVNTSNELIFRYDNTGHHKKLVLPTYPHHKHDGCEEHVIASDAPDLSSVLQEIELCIRLP
jgi:hypothetical protein